MQEVSGSIPLCSTIPSSVMEDFTLILPAFVTYTAQTCVRKKAPE